MLDLKPTDTVNNRYRVVRKLGAGAMGSVYLCEDIVENNIQVALKVLISENLDDQDVWAKGEYEALTRLRHPNLARVYNFGKIGNSGDYFIVSEFIKGVDLYSATEYVNYEELNDIIVQTCRALEYIHSRGYIHFDIKPDNILVTRHKTFGLKEGSKVQYTDEDFLEKNRSVYSKPNVKLIDFGLAEKITGSFSFAIKGTLNYLAPEIISGKTPDHRCDLYSLGVTLYQITNRALPYQCEDNEIHQTAMHSAKRSDLFEFHMKKHPEYLRVMILKLLEENPEKRFQSARDVIQFISKHSGSHFEVETKETQKSYLHSNRMVGRKKEIHVLRSLYEQIFCPNRLKPPAEEKPAEKPPPIEPGKSAAIKRPLDFLDAEETAPASPLASVADGAGLEEKIKIPVMALVSGEMGVGKTRLIEEFQHFLRLNNIQLYSGNCYEGTTNAYQPFIEVLRQMVYGIGLKSEGCQKYQQDLVKLLPELGENNDKAAPEADPAYRPDKEKHFFIDRIVQFLLDVALFKPFVLFINNLHWADEISFELLIALGERLFRQARDGELLKIMVVVSLRTDEQIPEDLKNILTRFKEINCCQEVLLRRLKRSQIVELLQSMLGFTEIPAQFLDRLEEKTGGNPLFIQETLKALQDEEILKHSDDGWQIKTTNYSRVEIPLNLEELLSRRIQKLEPVKKEILDMMSVLNRPISPKILQRFRRFSALPILAHLRDLEEGGLITKVFEGGKLTFQIDQPKMREILYSSLAEDHRRKYHGEAGEFFSELYRGREEEILEDLAYHYQRSDLTDQALSLAVKAGDRLKAIYANDKALDFYLYIVEKIDGDASKTALFLATQEKIGELCTIMGKYDLAEQSYDALLNFEDQEALSHESISRYYRNKGKVFEIQGDYDTALRCYKDARDHLASSPDPNLVDERIRVFNCIGWIYVCMGKYEKAMAISVEGLRVIEGTTEKVEHAMIFRTIGSANYYKGNYRQAVEFHSRSLKIQENLENIPEISVSLNNLGRAYMASGDYGEALDHFRRALKNSEEIGDPYGRAVGLHNLAWLYYELGKHDQAEAYVADSLQLSRGYKMRFLNIQNYILIGKILIDKKDYSRSESHLFRALTAFSKQGNKWGLSTVILEIVQIHRLRANYVEAASMVEEAFRYAVELDIDSLKARCLMEKGRVLRDSGEKDFEKLLSIFSEASSICAKSEFPELLAEIHQDAGDLLVRARRLDQAKDEYRKAEEEVREILERIPAEHVESYRQKRRIQFPLNDSRASAVEIQPADEEKSPREPLSRHTPAPIAGDRPPAGISTPGGPPREHPVGGGTLENMNELMQALRNSPNLESFLQLMLQRILNASRGKAAFVLARRGKRLQIFASLNLDKRRESQSAQLFPLKLVELVLQTRNALFIPDLVRDSRVAYLGGLIKAGYRSLALIPYQTMQEDGVVYLLDPVPQHPNLTEDLVYYNFYSNLLPIAFMHLQTSAAAATAEERESENA